MTHQEASSVVSLPEEEVYARLAEVEDWPRFLLGVKAVRRTAHERYVFTVADGSRSRDVEVAVRLHPAEARITWQALSGPRFDGELRVADAELLGHTRVMLSITAEPAGFLAGLAEMAGASSPAAVLDLQRLEAVLSPT